LGLTDSPTGIAVRFFERDVAHPVTSSDRKKEVKMFLCEKPKVTGPHAPFLVDQFMISVSAL
jgi:hypothetical protein